LKSGSLSHLKTQGNMPSALQTYEGWNFNSGNYLFTTDAK